MVLREVVVIIAPVEYCTTSGVRYQILTVDYHLR